MVTAYEAMQRDGYHSTYAGIANDLESANMNADLALAKFKAVVGDDHLDLVHQADSLISHNDGNTAKILSIGGQFGMPIK